MINNNLKVCKQADLLLPMNVKSSGVVFLGPRYLLPDGQMFEYQMELYKCCPRISARKRGLENVPQTTICWSRRTNGFDNDLLKLLFGVQDMIYFLQFLMDLKMYGLLSLSECRIGLPSFLTFVFLFDSQTFRSGDARPRW